MPLFTKDFKESPLWVDEVLPWEVPTADLPARIDVLVIGAGYTGLNAAIETARGGRSTLVIDAGPAGHGCSTRNGGQISTSIKPSLDALSRRVGRDRALAIRQTGLNALQWIESRVDELGIQCDFQRSGLFRAAHTPAHFKAQLLDLPVLSNQGIEAYPVTRDQQHRELGSVAYHGGLVYPQHASLHPARYHRGLLQYAVHSGVMVKDQCAAIAIERISSSVFRVTTESGVIEARDVIVATNGYTGALTPWLQRRVIPISSYVMATEVLPAELMDRLFPTNRNITDTCKVIYYYRPSPDRQRIVFGGRVSSGNTSIRESARRLHQQASRLFPEIAEFRVSHAWSGQVAYSFDELMHTGTHDGVHYSLGYCGSGVSMASYMGMRLGQKVLQLPEGCTAMDDLPFPTRPLYYGKPWFLPPLVAWYRWRDHIQTRLSERREG